MARRASIAVLCLWLLCAGLAHAAVHVQATLDRDHAALGDTVTLTIRIDGSASTLRAELDPLDRDFEILNRSLGSSRSWVNGKASSSSSLSITLQPRHAGTLRIPALTVDGQQTQPLTLEVSDAPAQAQGHAGDPAWLQLTLSTRKPYVGQQVAMDLKLFYSPDMVDGNLSQLHADGAQIKSLGRDVRYQVQRNGRRYRVIEKHFAMIPQRSGTIRLDPVIFRGHILSQANTGDFFSRGQAVGARSKTLQLAVRTRPKDYGSGPWLPARQVELSLSGWPAGGKVQVGEPLTLILHEGATGLSAAALPQLSLPDISGADVYPDHPRNDTQDNGQWITGSRSRSFAIVPNRTGTLSLPPITLKWWDVVHDKMRTAQIPAHHLQVTPATASGPGNGASRAAASASAATPVVAASVGPASAATANPALAAPHAMSNAGTSGWRLLALLSLVLWLLVLIGLAGWWWRRRRQARRPDVHADAAAPTGSRRLRNAFLAAARGGDMHAAARALLAWAQAERGGVRNLGDLAARVHDRAQIDAIHTLQRSQYAGDADATAVTDALADAFTRGLAWRAPAEGREDPAVPPLYPHR